MSATAGSVPPPVSWAQRNDLVFLIIDVECKDMEHRVTEESFTFKGVNALDESKRYDVTLHFLHSVDAEKATSKNIGRCLEFTIPKKESGPYWPTLTTDPTKLHFLKANFAKWRDESDNEDDNDGVATDQGILDNLRNNSNAGWNNQLDLDDLRDFNYFEGVEDDIDGNTPSPSQEDDEDNDSNVDGDNEL
ncbi:uncharacterized protein CG16817-like [Scaptodrosophila lebanonensis]|uniref:Uncharacterized protein CG16817-like n=1 Tax=Drosophila lebanonensis TaxID=7225 RepID=A0A6J2TQ76_DROLE|nr:uncharacterized protein CG16817-like [Scaptodrosophila lebanonensis]